MSKGKPAASDYAPLLVREDEDSSTTRPKPLAARVTITACYCIVMVINGGMCGAFGPSLEYFERSTGLSQGVLGSAVMQNRLAKLGGTIFWVLLVTASCCATLGFTRSGAALQLTMITSGFMYGVSDSAVNLLILWVWDHDPRKQRINVAVLNAMFTIGAFVTPMLIAASIHFLGGHVWPAYYILAAIAILEEYFLYPSLFIQACLMPLLPSPPPPSANRSAEASEIEMEAVPLPTNSTDDLRGDGVAARGNDDPERGATPKTPATASKQKLRFTKTNSSEQARRGWVYLGDAGSECIPPYMVVMVAVCSLCFFANGLEHATATWLPAYGIKYRGLGEETMAIMTSNFWTAMSLGRLAWACLSGVVTSSWPSLFMNTICCILSGILMAVPSTALLWSSAMGIGLGVASSFPASATLPPEMGIKMTPRMMTTLQLCASFGEMLCPFFMGIVFQMRQYWLFYGLCVAWEVMVFCLLAFAWLLLTRRLPLRAAWMCGEA